MTFVVSLSYLTSFSWVVAQEGDAVVELREAEVAVATLQRKVVELQESLLAAERKVGTLGEALASANAESSQFRDSYQKIRLQLEALGVSVLDDRESGIEQRLLQAVNDRRLLQEENGKLADEVFNLSEMLLNFMNSSVGAEPKVQEMADKALRHAEETLRMGLAKGEDTELPGVESVAAIQNARVISVKADFGLIVFNVGETHGVRVGMPFRVVRKERPIGTALIVEVREKICGAVVQSLASEEPFAVGDIGRVSAEENL